jgi:uncharacterized membrane protein (Fun14 family)
MEVVVMPINIKRIIHIIYLLIGIVLIPFLYFFTEGAIIMTGKAEFLIAPVLIMTLWLVAYIFSIRRANRK